MATMNISMPYELKTFVETRISMGDYQSASDYLRDLIRHDKEEIDRLLLEGIESGIAAPLEMSSIKKKARLLFEKEQKK